MANITPVVPRAALPPNTALCKTSSPPNAAAPKPASATDRVEQQGNLVPALLTIGTAAAAQLVPGVVEAEGFAGAAAAIGIAVRAATVNPVTNAIAAAAAGAAGSYVKSLVHDATAGQPVLKAISDFGSALDTSLHESLGIPQSEQR